MNTTGDHRSNRNHHRGEAPPLRDGRAQGACDPRSLFLDHPRCGDHNEDRRAALPGHRVRPWGIAVVKAVVLAKFMLLGNAMKIGERYNTKLLIWPVLHKALAFLVLLVIMTIIEEGIVTVTGSGTALRDGTLIRF